MRGHSSLLSSHRQPCILPCIRRPTRRPGPGRKQWSRSACFASPCRLCTARSQRTFERTYHIQPGRGGFQEREKRLREVLGSVVVGVNGLHRMLVRVIQMQHCSIVDLGNKSDQS